MPTKYGTRDEYLRAVRACHDAGLEVYADIVLNHRMGADEAETVRADAVNSANRNQDISPNEEIQAWTKFTFPGRHGKYSDFVWNWSCFDGVDWDDRRKRHQIFEFEGKTWENGVDTENGNYDYLMGADLDMKNPAVLEELDRAETEQDFLDIRGELRDAGFLRRQGKKEVSRPAKPLEFRTTSGFRVLVGRNNRQNDKLTCKDADRRDIWFHTQKIHGSHVILCTGGTEPDRRSIEEAASLAAYYSQGREGGKVPVDYTPVKFVKKPAGGKPGMVVYTTYQTIYAVPDEALTRRLSVR